MDNLAIIQQALQQFGGMQKQSGEFMMVCCPFHSDRNPSCGVYMSYTPRGRFTLGHYHCLGCSADGPWNEFAEQAGLPTIKEFESKQTYVSNVVTRDQEASLLGQDAGSMKSVLRALDAMEAQPWPPSIDWRGFSGKLLSRFGCYIAVDKADAGVALVLPVSVNNKIRGAVKAVYEKQEWTRTSYITSPGNWVSSVGLLGSDQAKTIIKKYGRKYVVLVEGPRDVLRLLKRGIPACAVLGVKNISQRKMDLCFALGVDCVYAMPDNDSAGTDMWKLIKKLARDKYVRRLKLPRERDEKGRLIKMDPFSMSDDVLDEVFDLLEKRHG